MVGQPQEAEDAEKDYWRAYTMDEVCQLPKQDWLIPDWIPEHGTGLLYAKSSVGKSFVAADFVYAVLTGQSWHGKGVKQGSVVYVATEGAEGFGKRLAALRQRAGNPSEAPFILVTRPVNLLDSQDVQRFIGYIKTLGTPEYPVRLIVFDTLNGCMPTVEDENSNPAMSKAERGARDIAESVHAFALLVHHTGKNGANARGGYALECNTDARLRLGDANTKPLRPWGVVKLYNEKQRDDKLQEPLTFTADVETLPDDSSSLVLVSGGKTRTPRKNTARRDERILAMKANGIPAEEIAEKLGIRSVGTVRSVISRKGRNATYATPKSRLHAV